MRVFCILPLNFVRPYDKLSRFLSLCSSMNIYYYNHHTYNSICTMSTTLGYVLTCPCICYSQCEWNFCAWNIVYPFLIRRYLDTKDVSKTIFRDSPEIKSITLYFRYVYCNMISCTLFYPNSKSSLFKFAIATLQSTSIDIGINAPLALTSNLFVPLPFSTNANNGLSISS